MVMFGQWRTKRSSGGSYLYLEQWNGYLWVIMMIKALPSESRWCYAA